MRIRAAAAEDSSSTTAADGEHAVSAIEIRRGHAVLNEDLVGRVFEFDSDSDEARVPCIGKLWAKVRRGQKWVISHDQNVQVTAFSPDGKTLAVGLGDGDAAVCAIYDVRTGKQKLFEIGQRTEFNRNYHRSIRHLTFTADGTMLVVSGPAPENRILFYDITTGRLRREIKTGFSAIKDVKFKPGDDTTLVLGTGMYLKVYDLAAQKIKKKLRSDSCSGSLVFSPDGSILATSGQNGKINLYDTATYELRDELDRDAAFAAVAFSRNGKLLAVGGRDNKVALYSFPDLEILGQFPFDDSILTLDFSPDSPTLAVGCGQERWKGELALLDLRTLIQRGRRLGRAVRSMRFSPDGSTLAIGIDKLVMLTDPVTNLVRLMRPRITSDAEDASDGDVDASAVEVIRMDMAWDTDTE